MAAKLRDHSSERLSGRLSRSSFSGSGVTEPWGELKDLVAKCPEWNPLCFGKSIWISTRYNDGEKGMIELDFANQRKRAFTYPAGLRPNKHVICKYDDETIVIVDGKNGKLATFNINTHDFSDPVEIPKLGFHCSAIAIKKYIHIFHGSKNENNQYLIYSMKNGKITTFKDDECPTQMHHVAVTAVTKGKGTKIYKFGVEKEGTNGPVHSFFTGTLKAKNGRKMGSQPIQWKETPKFALPKPLFGGGYVQYKSFIVIFGGSSNATVSILNMNNNTGWNVAAFKCPTVGQFAAVMDNEEENIHLFTYDQDVGAMRKDGYKALGSRQFVVGLKALGIKKDNGDEKVDEKEIDDIKSGDDVMSGQETQDDDEYGMFVHVRECNMNRNFQNVQYRRHDLKE